MKQKNRNLTLWLALAALALVVAPTDAFAASSGGQMASLVKAPKEFADVLTGPIAQAIGAIAFGAGFVTLALGGGQNGMSGVAQTICYVGIAVGGLVNAPTIMQMFGTKGATIGDTSAQAAPHEAPSGEDETGETFVWEASAP